MAAPQQTFLNLGERVRGNVARESNKGATAVLVALVAFTAYLYLSGRLRGMWQVVVGLPADIALTKEVTTREPAPTTSGPAGIVVRPKPGVSWGRGSVVQIVVGVPACYELLFRAYLQAGWTYAEAAGMAKKECQVGYHPKPLPVPFR